MQNKNQWLGQMGAALGLIISLSLVAYEMKQSRDLAMAKLYLERSALQSNWLAASYTPEMRPDAIVQAMRESEDLTWSQTGILQQHLFRGIVYFENQHYLYENGLVTQEEWVASKSFLAAYLRGPCSARSLLETLDTWRASFVLELKGIINELGADVEECRAPRLGELQERLAELS